LNIKVWKTLKVEQLTLRVTEVKGKVIPVHAVKPYRGEEVQLQSFLTIVLDGG